MCFSCINVNGNVKKIKQTLRQGPQYKKNFNDKRGIKRNLNTKNVDINATFEKLSFLNEASICNPILALYFATETS